MRLFFSERTLSVRPEPLAYVHRQHVPSGQIGVMEKDGKYVSKYLIHFICNLLKMLGKGRVTANSQSKVCHVMITTLTSVWIMCYLALTDQLSLSRPFPGHGRHRDLQTST